MELNNIYAVDLHLLPVFEHRSENYISRLILNALVHWLKFSLFLKTHLAEVK